MLAAKNISHKRKKDDLRIGTNMSCVLNSMIKMYSSSHNNMITLFEAVAVVRLNERYSKPATATKKYLNMRGTSGHLLISNNKI